MLLDEQRAAVDVVNLRQLHTSTLRSASDDFLHQFDQFGRAGQLAKACTRSTLGWAASPKAERMWQSGKTVTCSARGNRMSWDRKKGGPASGYFYESMRIEGKPHPVKVYRGRGNVGQLAASLVDSRRRNQQAARSAARAEAAATTEAEKLAEELNDWARLLMDAWLVANGYRFHRGSWRFRRGC